MLTERLITTELDPERQDHVQQMFDRLQISKTRGKEVGAEAVAYSAGFIAINATPLTISAIAEKTARDYCIIKRAVHALDDAGFIEKDASSRNTGNGKPPVLLLPKPELYEGIAITPSWQSATRACILATMLDVPVNEALDAAVSAQLSQRGIVQQNDAAKQA